MADAREKEAWVENALTLSKFSPHRWDPDGQFFRGSTQKELDNYGNWLKNVFDWLDGDSRYGPIVGCLDLGCGAGLWTRLFDGHEHLGCDQSSDMLRIARRNFPDHLFVQTNGRKLPFLDETFDLVFTRAVLQHNQFANDRVEVLTQIHRVLKPGGFYLGAEHPACFAWPCEEAKLVGFEILIRGAAECFVFRKRRGRSENRNSDGR